MIVSIVRLEEDFTFGTFGMLLIDGSIFCATLEPPDLLNKVGRSCIPAKSYEIARYFSTKFHKELYRVQNVPGRIGIVIHAGNTVNDTAGCILLGETVQKLKGPNRAIKNSGKTLEAFMTAMNKYSKAKLIIREMY